MKEPGQELKEVKQEFEKWRTTRIRKESIPEHLWSRAVKLLISHSISEVSKNLGVSYNQLKRFQDIYNQNNESFSQPIDYLEAQQQPEHFLEVTAKDITNPHCLPAISNQSKEENHYQQIEQRCQLIFERKDGGKLSMMLPLDWANLSLFCSHLLK
jgi:hypothetical protein